MANPRIVIVTPAAPGSRSGNRNTATRWARILRTLGYRVAIRTAWAGEPCDCLVALHAKKSHDALKAFVERFPRKPAILALTGTDLYRDIRVDGAAAESLQRAARLIVLQECAMAELDPALHARTRLIYQSEIARAPWQPPRKVFRLCVLGHLRAEKDPFRAALALRRLPPQAGVEVVQAGRPLSDGMRAEALELMAADRRYRWLGELPHWRALRLLVRSHAMIISSRMEGGAHVVSEAIAAGVPVIASDIPGNRGLLGAGYPAYYPVSDEAALAGLMARAMNDDGYLKRLASAVASRRPLIDPTREQDAWRQLLAELFLTPGPSPLQPAPERGDGDGH